MSLGAGNLGAMRASIASLSEQSHSMIVRMTHDLCDRSEPSQYSNAEADAALGRNACRSPQNTLPLWSFGDSGTRSRISRTQPFSRTPEKRPQLREWRITSLRAVRLRTAIMSAARPLSPRNSWNPGRSVWRTLLNRSFGRAGSLFCGGASTRRLRMPRWHAPTRSRSRLPPIHDGSQRLAGA
jgi:hypothetical protein